MQAVTEEKFTILFTSRFSVGTGELLFSVRVSGGQLVYSCTASWVKLYVDNEMWLVNGLQ